MDISNIFDLQHGVYGYHVQYLPVGSRSQWRQWRLGVIQKHGFEASTFFDD
tara:strand:+ start:219 stop:371 length:153 start_codon:yes stop_codon:yes gene_type:complete